MQAVAGEWILVGLSVVVLVVGLVLVHRVRRQTGRLSWAGFALTMFLAVLFYDFGMWRLDGSEGSPLLPVFYALQTMTANRDFELAGLGDASAAVVLALTWYGSALFICAPVSIVAAVIDYFSEALTVLRLRLASLTADSYVFSCLTERTLCLARDILASGEDGKGNAGKGKKPCVTFASCGDADEELYATARRLGALCLEADVEEVFRRCSTRHVRSLILFEDDEVTSLSTAHRLREEALAQRSGAAGSVRIFIRTDFRSTESLLSPEVSGGSAADERVVIRGIDPTRELVEQTILRYPLFLVDTPGSAASIPWYDTDAAAVDDHRRNRLYGGHDRHIAVVGAGAVGTEFLSSALWATQIDGVHATIDVLDPVEDPCKPGSPLAESRYAVAAPEIMTRRPHCDLQDKATDYATDGDKCYDLGFRLLDAETGHYDRYLADNADSLSYVFVATGDDLRNARIALHTRTVLERELARRTRSRSEYVAAPRPLIIAVIRNDEFADTVRRASENGQPYNIICVGSDEQILTKRLLDSQLSKSSEYKRSSSRASATHAKYRLFAFASNLYRDRQGVRAALAGLVDLSDPATVAKLLDDVDWSIDLGGDATDRSRARSWRIVELYNAYCSTDNAITRPLAGLGDAKPTRSWLLRMEHDRWNAYVRTQGFMRSELDETLRFFATGQLDEQKHRSNLMGLHACLVSFEALQTIDKPLYDEYQRYFAALDEHEGDSAGHEKRLGISPEDYFQMLDDAYIKI